MLIIKIASHSLSHPYFSRLTTSQMYQEMKSNDDLIFDIIGVGPTHMRLPYLDSNDAILNAMHSFGFKVISINLDSRDFEHTGSNAVLLNQASYDATMGARTGRDSSFISLQHDFATNSPQWVEAVIVNMRAKGFTLVTVAECIGDSRPYR